jgi:acyl-coenzyme A thioesterase PaaI-like protein
VTAPDPAPPPADADREGARLIAREVAAELRAVAELLNVRDPSVDALDAALRHATQVRAALADEPPLARWYELHAHGEGGRAASRGFHDEQGPIRGRANVVAPPFRLERGARDDGTPVLRGTVRLGRRYEGPPRCVHGGWVAALFDELLGATQSLAGIGGMTARLVVRYRRPTPIDEDLAFEGWIEQDRGRAVVVQGTCHARGQLVAQAEGLFMRVDVDAVQRKLHEEAGAAAAAADPGAPG